MTGFDENSLSKLRLMDPGMADALSASLKNRTRPLPPQTLEVIVQDILWGISEEIHMGQAMAEGYADLITGATPDVLHQYQRMVKASAEIGPAFGRVMAVYAPAAVATENKKLLIAFETTLHLMQKKGLHTIPEPLDALTRLLKSKDTDTARVYMTILRQNAKAMLPFNQTRHNCHHIAKALNTFSPQKRCWQLVQLLKVTSANAALVEPFLEGMAQGLHLLSKKNLSRFIKYGLQQASASFSRAKDFLSLKTFAARQSLLEMKTAVTLSEVQAPLSRYLQARIGRHIAIEPISSLSNALFSSDEKRPMVITNGQSIFLPDDIDICESYEENRRLFMVLAKLESALLEFGTFDFDLEKLMDRYPDLKPVAPLKPSNQFDLCVFFNAFPCPDLASDLFTLFEHGRLWMLMRRNYPGLVRQAKPIFLEESDRIRKLMPEPDIRFVLYMTITLGMNDSGQEGLPEPFIKIRRWLWKRFGALLNTDSSVLTCGRLVFETYPVVAELLKKENRGVSEPFPQPFQTPFGRNVYPFLFQSTYEHLIPQVEAFKERMGSRGLRVHRSDIRKELIQGSGRLSKESVATLLVNASIQNAPPPLGDILADLEENLPGLIIRNSPQALAPDANGLPVFWYSEWHHGLSDYLPRHVRVVERALPNTPAPGYHDILNNYHWLVRTIRRAFERLKPESLSLLRYWVEGDEFDYRALLNVVIDKKAGKMPSDRLYIKRIKTERDVAVLLLIDLSGSTKNRVAGTNKTVLSLEQEAIVLFCEALEVIGDTFAVAGFSGHGRLGVDYYQIKEFEEPLGENARNKISNMASQRSTRTGAAIRHAASKLENMSAKVRLLITLGDGYPNDLDYKGAYAVSDTRKAISEAQAKNVHVRPITVNLDANENMDTLYDSLHHNVISDVRDLPNQLWRIYSDFTR